MVVKWEERLCGFNQGEPDFAVLFTSGLSLSGETLDYGKFFPKGPTLYGLEKDVLAGCALLLGLAYYGITKKHNRKGFYQEETTFYNTYVPVLTPELQQMWHRLLAQDLQYDEVELLFLAVAKATEFGFSDSDVAQAHKFQQAFGISTQVIKKQEPTKRALIEYRITIDANYELFLVNFMNSKNRTYQVGEMVYEKLRIINKMDNCITCQYSFNGENIVKNIMNLLNAKGIEDIHVIFPNLKNSIFRDLINPQYDIAHHKAKWD